MVRVVSSSYEILTPFDGKTLLDLFERCGKVFLSPGSENKKTFSESLIHKGLEKDGDALLEHCFITVELTIDHAMAAELILASNTHFLQKSSLFSCSEQNIFSGELAVIKPHFIDVQSKAYQYWIDSVTDMEQTYLKLIELGEDLKTARCILPSCLVTQIIITANFRQWREMFKTFCNQKAHPGLQVVLRPLQDEFRCKIPIIFDDLDVFT